MLYYKGGFILILCRHVTCVANQFTIPAAAVEKAKEYGYLLHYETKDVDLKNDHVTLTLVNLNPTVKENPFSIDFCNDRMIQRRKQAQNELVVKACSTSGSNGILYDFTGGLGRDSFLLGSTYSKVVIVERNLILFLLLDDAVRRLRIKDSVHGNRLNVINGDAANLKLSDELPNVVYLDPMYPENEVGRKSSVKKEMQILHRLLGNNEGSDHSNNEQLFNTAVRLAQKKVVVKRPLGSAPLCDSIPHSTIKGSTHRFDMYHTAQPVKFSSPRLHTLR